MQTNPVNRHYNKVETTNAKDLLHRGLWTLPGLSADPDFKKISSQKPHNQWVFKFLHQR